MEHFRIRSILGASSFFVFGVFITGETLAALPASEESELIVELKNVRSDSGQIAFAVFSEDSQKDFPRAPERAVLTKLVDAKKGESLVPLGKLKPGKYAISLLHDENKDGKMNFNFVGMPKEGFGFSRNPTIMFGPPDFGKCVFEISEKEARVSMNAKYF